MASGHKPFPSVVVNITDLSTMYCVETIKLAKDEPQEKAKSSKSPHLAEGSPAPAEGNRRDKNCKPQTDFRHSQLPSFPPVIAAASLLDRSFIYLTLHIFP